MDWQALFTTLGGAGIIIGAAAWLTKQLVNAWLSKDLETFKSELHSKSAIAIEEFRSQMQVELQKRVIEYSALHGKRGELIAELYSRLCALHQAIQRLMFQMGSREYREQTWREISSPKEPWEIKPGVDTLDATESAQLEKLKQLSLEFFDFYGRNKIYFSTEVCDLIDRLSTISGYLSVNYENVAIKDEKGMLRVNPKVKTVWDSAIAAIPALFTALEHEFRSLLGVK